MATTKLLELYDSRKFRKAVLKAMGHMADLRVIPFLMEKAGEPGSPLMDLLDAIARTFTPVSPPPCSKGTRRRWHSS